MGEMEITDCWSLFAVVNECSQLQAQRNTETNLTTSVTNASVGPLKTNYSAFNFMLPSAATPAAVQGSIPQDGPTNLHKLPRAQLNTETNLTASATTASVGPLETNYWATNFMLPSAATFFAAQGNIPKDAPKNLHKLPRAQFNIETNLTTSVTTTSFNPLKTNYSAVNFMLPSATTPVATQVSFSEDGPRNLHKLLRAQLNTETNLPTFATTASVGPLKTNYSAVNFTLPFAASATPAAVQGSVSKDESRYLHTLPLPPPHHPPRHHPPRVTSTLKTPMTKSTTNLIVQQNPQQQPLRRNFSLKGNLGSSSFGVDHHCFYKRKKFEERRVMKWTLEELSTNDDWAWRKYGQKPIKGSPYPRNYYKCSSMKGCNARRQVERSPIDPYTYIVTYTSNHFHPPPPTRILSKPRVKYSGSEMDPPPAPKSPTETTIPGEIGSGCESKSGTAVQGQIRPEYGSGSGSGGNAVKFNEDKRHDNCGRSLGRGIMDKGNKEKDHEILIPKSMAGSDLLTGMEQLDGEEKISHHCNCRSRIARI